MKLHNKYLLIKESNGLCYFYKILDKCIERIFVDESYTLKYTFEENILKIYENDSILYEATYNETVSNWYNNEYIFFEGHDNENKKCSLLISDYIARLWQSTTRFSCYKYIKNKVLQSVGEHTYGKFNLPDYDKDSRIIIGDYCSFSEGLAIIMRDHASKNISTYPFDALRAVYGIKFVPENNHVVKNKTLTIGNDVWIGYDVKIMPSVSKIEDGAIIAAGSVVTKNVEPYSIVGGVPAKLIKYRFEKEQIKELLKIKWWNWDEKTIKKRLNEIVSPDIDTFIEKYKKH